MRRSFHAPAATSVLIAGVLLTSGCQGQAHVTHGPTQSASGSAATTVAAAPVPTGPVTVAQLVAALPAAPAGSKPWAGTSGLSGPLTRTQYVTAEFGAKDGAKLLKAEEQLGLTFGAQNGWRQQDKVMVGVRLADYKDRTGAKTAYLEIQSSAEEDDAGDNDFTLPGAADSFGIGDPTPDQAGNTVTNLFALAGKELLRVTVESPAGVDQATAKAVALKAYANLCKLSDCTAGSVS